MNTYINPAVEINPGATGLDKAIESIQVQLAGIPWLEKAFGRATQQKGKLVVKSGEKRTEREYTFPEVYNKREPLSLMVNDNLQSYCFFHLIGPMKFLNYEPGATSQMVEQPIAIIFWVNLKKIDSTLNFDFSEALRAEAYLKIARNYGFEMQESLIQVEAVFNPYTITETFKTFLKPPFAAFRFDGLLTYDYAEVCV